jgi:hypothetical protein
MQRQLSPHNEIGFGLIAVFIIVIGTWNLLPEAKKAEMFPRKTH